MQNSRNCLNVVSNRSDKLVTALGETLFSGKPFASKVVIIPSFAVKTEILFSFAQNKSWGVCAGVQFYSMEQFLLVQLLNSRSEKRLLSAFELSFIIEYELHRALKDPLLEELFLPVQRYVQTEIKKGEQRITALSHELSALFLKYAMYDLDFLDEWLKKPGWQQHVWKQSFTEQWTYPTELCQQEVTSPYPIHLFGFTYIPPVYRSYFMRMGATFYLLSPSPLFLGDVCTDRERLYVEKVGERIGAGLIERKELDTLLKEPNRLIANFGKLRRSTLSLLEEEQCLLDERYEEPMPTTLLQFLQEDLYHLRNPERVRDVTRDDRSIQVHAACSLYREVELLRDHIVHRIKEGVALKEMGVLSSNLSAYLPYIEAVFGADEYPIPFVVTDVKRGGAFELGFLHLLSLKESRVEKEEVLKLFSCTPFFERLGFDERDSELFCSWVRSSNLHWGFNARHRQKVLSSNEVSSEAGTWEWAFDRLLWGLALKDSKEEGFDSPVSPHGAISLTEADVLGKGIGAVLEIKKYFDEMEEEPNRGFHQWVTVLEEIARSFFVETAESKALFSELEKVKKKLKCLEESFFSFESFLAGIHRFFLRKKGSISSSTLEAVSFHPLREGNIRQARTLFLLGAQEGAFPRKERTSPFLDAEFIKQTKAPLVIDEERNLFLEMLLQAREEFVISYQNVSDDDGKEMQPSLFIQELFSYLDQGCVIEGKKPSVALLTDHPACAFDESTASSPSHYDAARALYTTPQKAMPSFFDESLKKDQRDQVISLKRLSSCARHPIQYFLNQTLGIYCEWSEGLDEEFILSPLEKMRMRKDSLTMPLETVIKKAEITGTLPMWQFGSVARQVVLDEMTEYRQALKKLHVDPSSLFDIEFVEHLEEETPLSKRCVLFPALEVSRLDGSRVKIVGKLSDLSSRGMLVHGKASLEEIAKVWPAFLIYLLVDSKRLVERSLLFTKEGKEKTFSIENPKELLAKYLDYYEACSGQISLFMPRWADALIHGDADALKKKISATEKEVKRQRGDPYLQWFFMREKECDVKAFYIQRASQIREVMHGVV